MNRSWVLNNVSQFALVFRSTCSIWFSNRRFFLGPGRWLVLAFPLAPTFTCAFGCVVVLEVVVSKLKESGTAKLAA